MKKYFPFAICFAILAVSCQKEDISNEYTENEWLSGGVQTVFDEGAGSFSHPFPVMDNFKQRVHEIGDIGFEAAFVTSPAQLNPGLGPVFNNVSCASCHIADGRGKPSVPGEQPQSLLIRISVQGTDAYGGPNPVPGFGGQLQPRSIAGQLAEAEVTTIHSYLTIYFSDGTGHELIVPQYLISNAYTNYPSNTMQSARIAPPVFGLGLLEAVDEKEILKYADEADVNGDGISGKANIVYDYEKSIYTLGRFGWKAGQPNLKQQTAGAYNEDMGITNPIFSKESCEQQPQHDGKYDETEISDSILHAVTFYVKTLAVPARRNADHAVVLEGKNIFMNSGCGSCHRPSMTTAVNVTFPEISNQKIFPYSDLLLHDMGEGLADNRPEYLANGREWRTPPLWGIGLTKVVNGHQYFLHDGRARNFMEAILWHGGEAEESANKVRNLKAAERQKLVAFLESL